MANEVTYAKAENLSRMKNFKCVSQHNFLSVSQANMPYHNRHSSQKAGIVLVFHVRKMFR